LPLSGAWPLLLRGDAPRLWALIISGILMALALLLPSILKPIYHVWMRIGAILGWVNTRIILAIGFFLGLFPDGMGYASFREGCFASKVGPNLEHLSCAAIIQTRFTPGKAILTWRDYHGRISDRALGIYEGT